jgi:hypothetical protein
LIKKLKVLNLDSFINKETPSDFQGQFKLNRKQMQQNLLFEIQRRELMDLLEQDFF